MPVVNNNSNNILIWKRLRKNLWANRAKYKCTHHNMTQHMIMIDMVLPVTDAPRKNTKVLIK